MLNKDKWMERFYNLNPDNQLKVAKLIVSELEENESIFNEKDYDLEASKAVRNFLFSYMNEVKNKREKN